MLRKWAESEPRDNSFSSGIGSVLVDKELGPGALEACRALATSFVRPLRERVREAFLGTGNYDLIGQDLGRLKACLLLECLIPFVHECGGKIVWAGSIQQGDVKKAVQQTVNVKSQVRQFLRAGDLFIHFAHQRIVLYAEPDPTDPHEEYLMEVCSDKSAANFLTDWEEYARKHSYLQKQKFFADGEIIQNDRIYTWDDIILPEEIKRAVHMHLEGFLRNQTRLRSLGVKPRRGLIFAGPPGTGKTLLGKVLADTMDVSFVWVTPRHIRNPASFEEILSVARLVTPTVLFLEDLDLFGEERHSNKWLGLGELMNQLDGVVDNCDIAVVATTNRLDVVENALRNRPGRFDRVVAFEAMDSQCRTRMLRRLLKKARITEDDFSHLVTRSEDYTGAQLQELVNTLYMLAAELEQINPIEMLPEPADTPAETQPIMVDRSMVEAALEDFQVERKRKMGFQVA